MLRHYELLAVSDNLTEMGIKRIRRVGHHTEFEQIKEYVKGDDYRTINWKASARRHELMVNVYQDERSQQIYNVIDKGRVMQQAFRGMTLLDYAINASLVLSYVAMRREDRAGLVTFDGPFRHVRSGFAASGPHAGAARGALVRSRPLSARRTSRRFACIWTSTWRSAACWCCTPISSA